MMINSSTAPPMIFGRKARSMALPDVGAPPNGGPGLRGGSGMVFQLAESLQILQLKHEIVPAADDQRCEAVPFIHNLQVHERGVVLQGLAADANGLGFAFG